MSYHDLTMREYWEMKKAERKALRLKKDIQYIAAWLLCFIGIMLSYHFAASMSWLVSAAAGLGIVSLGILLDVFIMEGVRD